MKASAGATLSSAVSSQSSIRSSAAWALEDDGHSHMMAGKFSSIKMNADGPISWPEHHPNYALSAVGKALDKRHLSLYNNYNNTQGWP